MANKYRYRHSIHTMNKWQEILWNYPDELQAEMASICHEFAEDWLGVEATDDAINLIANSIEIELVLRGN